MYLLLFLLATPFQSLTNPYMKIKSYKLYLKSLLIVLSVFLFSFNGFSQVRKSFTQRTSSFSPTRTIYSINGDFTMIGNTNLSLLNYSTTDINSNNIMIKVDADNDASTNNSSAATLNFSQENQANPGCSHVVFAGLYWSARTDGTPSELEKRTVKFKGPNQSNYTTYTATSNDIYYPGDNDMYVGFTEVTSQVQQCGTGQYWLADMALTEGNGGSTGYYGGWGMVIVYENSQMKKRDITVFDGYAYVVGGTAQWELPVAGFNTVLSGAVNTKLGLMAGEGDVGISGDQFEIQKQNSANWLVLSHADNSPTNFFNSSIYTDGNARTPNLQNNTGMDISMFQIPNANNEVINNGQTATKFRYSSTQDTYIIYSICMAVDAYEPAVEGFLSLLNVNGTPSATSNITVNPGDEIQYKVQIRNKGNEPVNNARIEVPLPYAAITYLGSTTNVYAPATSTSQPYVDANAGANGTLIWDFGTLPVPASPNQVLGEVVFTLKVTEDCALYQNYNCAVPGVEINGAISGTGANTGIQVDQQPFYVGYSATSNCVTEPLLGPFNINIDSYNWVTANCTAGDSIRDFYFCNRTNPIPVTDILGYYPAGTRFFDSTLTVEYTISNPFPVLSGPVLYRAVLQSNCVLSFSLSIINTIVNTVPTITTTDIAYCQGSQAVPLVATPSDPNYQLYYFAPGSNIAQPLLVPSTLNAGNFIYQVAEGPSASCISTMRANIPVLINPAPVFNATVNQIACYGNTGSVDFTVSGGTGSITLDVNNPSTTNLNAGSYSYTATDSIGCSSTFTALINAAPALPALPTLACYETASWNASTCSWDVSGSQPAQPALACYESASFNTSTCQWDVTGSPAPAIITNAQVCGAYTWSTNNSVYTQSGTYTYNENCQDYTLNLIINTESTSATSAVASASAITIGGTVTLSVNGGSLGTNANWVWYSGACGDSLVGTGSSITIAPSSTRTYFVRAEGECNTTTCVSVSVIVYPPCGPNYVTSNTNSFTICKGTSITLTVQGYAGINGVWKWFKGSCGTTSCSSAIFTGQSYTVTPLFTTTYYVRATGGSCGTTSCIPVTVTVIPPPATPSVITGPASGLCNAQNVTYSVTNVAGVTYNWTVPTGATIVSGQGTNAVVVNFSNVLTGSGTCSSSPVICVTGSNYCGTSSSRCLTLSLKPGKPVSISGPSNVTANQIVTYSIAPVAGATSYTWTKPYNWTILSGQGTTSIQVKVGTSTGSITVKANNACGSGYAATKSISFGSCSRVANEVVSSDLLLYPNPTNGILNIESNSIYTKIDIYDVLGTLVMSFGNDKQIDLSNLKSGLYLIRFTSENGVEQRRVEVSK